MQSRLIEPLRKAELFEGLSDDELQHVADICTAARISEGGTIFQEGDSGGELFIIYEGAVRVMINTRDTQGNATRATINTLYTGQCFGEMVLLNGAIRSATIVAAVATTLLILHQTSFHKLCESNPRIGYVVMQNLARDLAFKLRSSNLLLRGNIRWRDGELG